MRKLFPVIALAVTAAALSPAAYAQATASATLTGTVTDKTGAVLPNATLKISNNATGLVREKTTNEVGIYRFDLLPAGTYTLKVAAAGFATLNYEKVELPVGITTTLDPSMSPSNQAETITVEATGAPLVDVAKTDVSLAIRPQDVIELPLNGRDFANLAYLAPGAKPVDSYDPTKNRTGVFGINGSSGRNVNVTVNGIDNKDNTVGGPVMQFALEAIQEFNISTQRFSAANGRSEGAAVNVITKSGSNQLHGSYFYFFRDKALNALNYFEKRENGGTNVKAPFRRHQTGGTIGGPIVKDRAFFFFAIERQIEDTSINITPQAVRELTQVQNLGAQPSAVAPTPYRDWRYTGRGDFKFSDKHNLFASYSAQSNKGENDQITQTSDLTAGNVTTNELILANLTLNSVLSPRIVNAFTTGYQYWSNLIDAKVYTNALFFPGGITFGTNTNVPQQSYQAKWQFRDDLSWLVGKHALKMGFDFVYQPKLGGFFAFNATPNITFLDLPSVILGDRTKYPQGFATPGAVTGISYTSGNPYFDLPGGTKMFGTYIQDDFKVSKRLTINAGIRWDRDFNLIGGANQGASRTFLQLQKINSPYAGSVPNDFNLGFSPRFGFAYDVAGTGKHVIRGGYGIYIGQTFLNTPLFMLQQVNPTLFATVLSLGSAGPGDTQADIVPGINRPLSTFRFGVDPLPPIPGPRTQFVGNEVGRLMDPDFKPPYTQQWNLGYAYQFNSSNVLEFEYIHTLGLREAKTININPRRLTNPGAARDLDAAFRAANLPLLNRIDVEQSTGRSRYDGFNIVFRRRLSRHFSLNTNYVFSKAVAYAGTAAAFRNRPTDLNNIFQPSDLGPTPQDERHRWVAAGFVTLPWGVQLSPVMQWASARPWNTGAGQDVFGWGGGANAGAPRAILQRSNPSNLRATANFTLAQLRAGLADGSLFQDSFDSQRGIPFFQVDVRVSKFVKFGERAKAEVFFQSFNLSNRANFGGNFVGNIRSTAFGTPNGFITPNGAILPRSFSAEFGGRFSF